MNPAVRLRYSIGLRIRKMPLQRALAQMVSCSSCGTFSVTRMSGSIPFAWIERPDGVW